MGWHFYCLCRVANHRGYFEMSAKYWIALFAIAVIGGLEAYALSQGIDGTLFSTAAAGIGGIAGYVLKK